jgi:hypothetical protein
VLSLRELPEKVPINIEKAQTDDMNWQIGMDIDNNLSTGDHNGDEYMIMIHHSSTGGAQSLGRIEDFPATLFQPHGDQSEYAQWYPLWNVPKIIDREKKTITLTVNLPVSLRPETKITVDGYAENKGFREFTCRK